jgi:hypothetical protein
VALLPHDHRWSGADSIPARKLAEEKLLLLGAGHCFREQVIEDCPQCVDPDSDGPWSGITLGACNDEGGPDLAPCHPDVDGIARNNLVLERHGPIGCGVQFIEAHIDSGQAENNIVADDGDGAICNPVQADPPVVQTGTSYVQGPSDPANPSLTFLGAVSARSGREGTTEEFFRVAVEQRKFSYRPEYGAPALIELFRSLR